MKPLTRRRIYLAAAFSAYFGVLWMFWTTPIVFPLKIFVVLLHEISHAVAALATGGTVERIVLTADEGGATFAAGGNALATLSAGYLGSLLWGLGMLEAAYARPAVQRAALAALGGILAAAAVLYVRNIFGLVFSLVFGLALLATAARVPPRGRAIVLAGLGLTSALYAILDMRSDIFARPALRSDARILADWTGVPSLVWGSLWIGVALLLTALMTRRIFRRA